MLTSSMIKNDDSPFKRMLFLKEDLMLMDTSKAKKDKTTYA